MFVRARKTIACLALCFALSAPAATAARFVDVPGNWAQIYIDILSDKGYFPAEPDGKFKPDDPVTRAALASWIVKTLGIENQQVSQTPSFPDVKPTDWFYKPVEIIRQNNYISGYQDGFRPNQFIQKGEVITIIARITGLPDQGDDAAKTELAKYKDQQKVPEWAQKAAAKLSSNGLLLVGPDTGSIGADKLATRADTAALLFKLDEFVGRRDVAQAVKNATQPPQNTAYAPPQQPAYGAPPQGYGQPPQQGYSQPPQQGYAQPQWGQSMPPAQMMQQPPMAPQQGRVNMQGDYFPSQAGQQPQYMPPQQPAYGQPPPGYPPPQANMLQGGVAIVSAGTQFRATLKNSLDSGASQPGEEVRATLQDPLYANGQEAVPAGSMLVGQVTSVTPAKRLHATAPGKIDIRFTQLETPDGRKFPLSAVIDTSSGDIKLSGNTTMGRVGKGLVTTGVGAAGGAALGTALGAIVGGTSNGNVGKATGMGAVFGTALGAGVGGVTALVQKGNEIKIPAGSSLPVKLDQQMQVTMRQSGPFGMPQGMQPQSNFGQQWGQQPTWNGQPNYGGQPYNPNPPQGWTGQQNYGY